MNFGVDWFSVSFETKVLVILGGVKIFSEEMTLKFQAFYIKLEFSELNKLCTNVSYLLNYASLNFHPALTGVGGIFQPTNAENP